MDKRLGVASAAVIAALSACSPGPAMVNHRPVAPVGRSGHIVAHVRPTGATAIATAFHRLALMNGESRPRDARYVVTTYRQADKLLNEGQPPQRFGRKRVYLVIARGTFVLRDAQTIRPTTGKTLYAAYTRNAVIMEWGILHYRPDVSRLGNVVPLPL